MQENAQTSGIDSFIKKIEHCEKEIFSASDLEKLTGVDKQFFYKAHRDSLIPTLKFGAQVRFLKSDVIEWVKSCSNPKKKGDIYERR